MIKGSIQEEDITIVNIFAPNIGAPQYMRQTLTGVTRENDSNAIVVGDFNTPLTPMADHQNRSILFLGRFRHSSEVGGQDNHGVVETSVNSCKQIYLVVSVSTG